MKNRRENAGSVRFINGPSIKIGKVLLDWLNNETILQSGEKLLIRMPVVVVFEGNHHIAIEIVYVGVKDDIMRKGVVKLKIDDTMMGMPLLFYLRNMCSKDGLTCAVWIEGYGGANFTSFLTDKYTSTQDQDDVLEYHFTVLKVLGPVQEVSDNLDDIHVLIEDRSA